MTVLPKGEVMSRNSEWFASEEARENEPKEKVVYLRPVADAESRVLRVWCQCFSEDHVGEGE